MFSLKLYKIKTGYEKVYKKDVRTLAASHLNRAVLSSGAVVNDAEGRITVKYHRLSPLYSFTPIAVETFGAIGNEADAFFRIVGKRMSDVT